MNVFICGGHKRRAHPTKLKGGGLISGRWMGGSAPAVIRGESPLLQGLWLFRSLRGSNLKGG